MITVHFFLGIHHSFIITRFVRLEFITVSVSALINHVNYRSWPFPVLTNPKLLPMILELITETSVLLP